MLAADLKSAGGSEEILQPQILRDISKAGGAQSGAQLPQTDPELACLMDAWPTLPQAVKAGIVAMVQVAK